MGAISLLQGLSGVGKDIPPFSIAIGKDGVSAINVVGLRRAGFNPAERKEVKRAFHLLYESGLNVSQALDRAAKEDWSAPAQAFFEFVRQAKRRGICALRLTREEPPDD